MRWRGVIRRPRAPLPPLPRHCPSGSFRDDSSSGLEALVLLTSFVVFDKVSWYLEKIFAAYILQNFQMDPTTLNQALSSSVKCIGRWTICSKFCRNFCSQILGKLAEDFVRLQRLPSSTVVIYQVFAAHFADVFEVAKLRRSSLRCQPFFCLR